jgi:hypothetical protein
MLTPCPSCDRHVRAAERACPFCTAILALTQPAPRSASTQRLGRGALFAFGASVASAMGCGTATTADVGAPDAVTTSTDATIGSDAGSDTGNDAYTGLDAAPSNDAAPPSDASQQRDPCADAGFFAAYGGPWFPCDANVSDLGVSSDAAADDALPDGWGAALYGSPPPPPEP